MSFKISQFLKRNHKLIYSIVSGFLCAVTVSGFYISNTSFLNRIDDKVYDLLLPLRAQVKPSDVPVIIDIDEESLKTYGQWPWSRYLVSDLIKSLKYYNIAVIGTDVMFAEYDKSSPKQVASNLARDKNAHIDFTGLPTDMFDYDKLFASAVGGAPVVLGAYARFEGDLPDNKLPPSVNIIEVSNSDTDWKKYLQFAPNATLPLAELSANAPVGLINVFKDDDGIVRQIPLLMRIKDRVYPSLALRTLMLAMGEKNLIVNISQDGLESVKIGDFVTPTTREGTMMVPFVGKHKTYSYYSAKDILQRKIPVEKLDGKIAFLGTSAVGLLDIISTPLDPFFPGVEVHAAAIDTIIAGNAITIPPWIPGIQIILIFFVCAISTIIFGRLKSWVYLPTAAMLIGGAILLSRYLFANGMFLSPLYAIISIVILGIYFIFLRFWNEEKQKSIIKNAFSHYVSPQIVERLSKDHGDIFGGEEKELAILFSDIRGFTSISEGLKPSQIVRMLNIYFTEMTKIIRKNSGTVDKFIGDSVMAFWNAPIDVNNYSELAVSTAIEMQQKLEILNKKIHAEFDVDIHTGIGIHTGTAYVGNIGSKEILNYTLIGDNVNLASRLEGLCKIYGVDIIISEDTMIKSGDNFKYQILDVVRVKGKNNHTRIYRPLPKDSKDDFSEWTKGFNSYVNGDFETAYLIFNKLATEDPKSILYKTYLERTTILLEKTPDNWDGSWTMDCK
jgi:adenylate cyclase